MFRRTAISAEDAIERSREIYTPLGGVFNQTKLRWRMPNGGRVTFAYLDNSEDAQQYQGRNVTDAWVEEAGQYPSSEPIDRLYGLLRSAAGVPVQLILTANPGGAGQHWLRERYQLAPFPEYPRLMTRTLSNGAIHEFAVIPSRLVNNKILLDRDPDYVQRLHLVGSQQLVRAWLEGDWNAIEGAFFQEWSEAKHVIAPFAVPDEWMRFRSADWGSAAPFSIGWWAVAGDDFHRGDLLIPRSAIVCYREWYGALKPNVGLKMTAEEVADGIIKREAADRRLSYGVLDPSTFKQDGGPSVAERINLRLSARKLAPFRRADNSRVTRQVGDRTKSGPMGGWDAMRQRLIGINGRPMIYFFSTCRDSIRTIPMLQHDETRTEDLDTDAEDHAADSVRYACLSRPWVPRKLPPPEPRDAYRSAADRDFSVSSSILTL